MGHDTTSRGNEGDAPDSALSDDDDQTIFRAIKDRDYAIIKNSVLRDGRLTWEARGVLGYLLTKPDDWEVRVPDLIHQGPAGRDVIRRILRELTEHGYLQRKRVQTQDGTFKWVSQVYETPRPPSPENPSMDDPAQSAETLHPSTGYPSMDDPSTDDPSTDDPSIYERRRVPRRTESPTPDPPTPERASRGAGGAARPATAKQDPPESPPPMAQRPPRYTETEFWLRQQGVSEKRATQYRQFDLAAVQADLRSEIGDATGEERQWRIGRVLKRWEVAPPHVGTGDAVPHGPIDVDRYTNGAYGDLFRRGSDISDLEPLNDEAQEKAAGG